MKRIRTFVVSLAILAVLVCVWQLWPHSLEDILDTGGNAFDTVTIVASEFYISCGAENGTPGSKPHIDTYGLDIDSPEDEHYAQVMAMIGSTKFRSDFRNLLPWDVLSVDSGGGNITHSAVVRLTWGSAGGGCSMTFHGDDVISLGIDGKTGFLAYHPTNRTLLKQLAAYAKENGDFVSGSRD